jgi:hypothetical protein
MAVEPASGRRFRISTGNGMKPSWRQDGREVFYVTSQGDLMAAPVLAGPNVGPAVRLMRLCQDTAPPSLNPTGVSASTAFAVARDGQRVLAICQSVKAETSVTVELGWQSRLTQQ